MFVVKIVGAHVAKSKRCVRSPTLSALGLLRAEKGGGEPTWAGAQHAGKSPSRWRKTTGVPKEPAALPDVDS